MNPFNRTIREISMPVESGDGRRPRLAALRSTSRPQPFALCWRGVRQDYGMTETTAYPLPRSVHRFAPWMWRKRWLVAWAILGLLMAYIGALGPAALVASKSGQIARTVAEIYRPLLFVRFRCEMVARPLDLYAGLWSRQGWFRVNQNHLFWYEHGGQAIPISDEIMRRYPPRL